MLLRLTRDTASQHEGMSIYRGGKETRPISVLLVLFLINKVVFKMHFKPFLTIIDQEGQTLLWKLTYLNISDMQGEGEDNELLKLL